MQSQSSEQPAMPTSHTISLGLAAPDQQLICHSKSLVMALSAILDTEVSYSCPVVSEIRSAIEQLRYYVQDQRDVAEQDHLPIDLQDLLEEGEALFTIQRGKTYLQAFVENFAPGAIQSCLTATNAYRGLVATMELNYGPLTSGVVQLGKRKMIDDVNDSDAAPDWTGTQSGGNSSFTQQVPTSASAQERKRPKRIPVGRLNRFIPSAVSYTGSLFSQTTIRT
jgi:hypothetical protein